MKIKKQKKWLRLLVLIPLVVFLVFTNVHVDPASIYHDYSKVVATEIINGNKPYFSSFNGDERGVKQHLIEYMPKHVECITVGPSLSLGIRKENVGVNDYYNLSVSEANINDIMAEFALLDINGVKTDRLILCVDSYFFDELHSVSSQKQEWMPYAEYMMAKLDGESPEVPSGELEFFSDENLDKISTQVEQAVSIKYFQACFEVVKMNHSYIQKNRCGIIDESTEDYAHFMPDGSWEYMAKTKSNTEEDVVQFAESYDIDAEFEYGKHVNPEKFEYFDKLINYLLEQGVEIELYMCPLCPSLWDRLDTDSENCQFYILNEIEEHARNVAETYDLKVTGSYNPYNLGVKDSDYYDSRHFRHDRLGEYFDFSE